MFKWLLVLSVFSSQAYAEARGCQTEGLNMFETAARMASCAPKLATLTAGYEEYKIQDKADVENNLRHTNERLALLEQMRPKLGAIEAKILENFNRQTPQEVRDRIMTAYRNFHEANRNYDRFGDDYSYNYIMERYPHLDKEGREYRERTLERFGFDYFSRGEYLSDISPEGTEDLAGTIRLGSERENLFAAVDRNRFFRPDRILGADFPIRDFVSFNIDESTEVMIYTNSAEFSSSGYAWPEPTFFPGHYHFLVNLPNETGHLSEFYFGIKPHIDENGVFSFKIDMNEDMHQTYLARDTERLRRLNSGTHDPEHFNRYLYYRLDAKCHSLFGVTIP